MQKIQFPMKIRYKLTSLLLLLLMLLTSCRQQSPSFGGGNVSLGGAEQRITLEADKIAIFENGEVDGFWARNDRGNGHPFNCSFSNKNAVIADGYLTITLNEDTGKYVGAEYRSMERYSYGFYSVKMKAA